MTHNSLNAVLIRAREEKLPVTVGILGGHRLTVVISACGDGWFTGETREGAPRGVVVVCHAVVALWGAPHPTVPSAAREDSSLPLTRVLQNLVALTKTVRVHTSGGVRTGVLTHAAEDYLVMSGTGDHAMMVPYVALHWLEIR